MPMRVSITIDADTMDLVDRYAKDHGLERNRAITECIQTGIACLTEGTGVPVTQPRTFDEYLEIKAALSDVKTVLSNLTEEIRVMHHTIEVEWLRENRTVPYQSKKWYEFWKT
ncbi:MAG: type II secretion system protein E [Methanolinea sp.]|nr:type II secretion system protein E [Methanolinea sp.]